MALYDLVNFRNQLADCISSLSLSHAINSKKDAVKIIRTMHGFYSADLESTMGKYDNLDVESEQIIAHLKLTLDKIDTDIKNYVQINFTSAEYLNRFTASTINYHSDAPEYLVSDSSKDYIKNKVTKYCDWHYPGLMIGTRFRNWIDAMVVSDPLYLTMPVITVDPDAYIGFSKNIKRYQYSSDFDKINEHYSKLLLEELIKHHTHQFQNRLRLYAIKDNDFTILPQNQFAVVLAWEYFNYINMQEIELYLNKVYNLLRPGGTYVFSYNNCDLPDSAKLADDGYMSYASQSDLIDIATSIGYTVSAAENRLTKDGHFRYTSWLELTKPGKLRTTKALQTIGRIREK